MRSEDLDTDAVVSMYEESYPLHERRWEREGHRSYHHGYHDDDEDESEAAERMIAEVAAAAGVAETDRVLDLGCGVGEDATWLARNVGASVVGVNVHERQLEAAREYAAESGVDDLVSVHYDDFHELETVADDSVDVVWGLEALCHSHDDGRVVEQADRVLDDGGRVVFADLFLRRSELSDTDAGRLRKLYDSWDVQYDPIDDLERSLVENGFENVDVRDVTEAVFPSVERDYRMSLYSYPYYRVMSLLGRADDRLVGLSIGGYHCHELFQRGALGYYIVSAEV